MHPAPEPADVQRERKLLRDALCNNLGPIFGSLLGLLLVPLYLRALGVERYGLWISAVTLATTIGAFDAGLTYCITRAVARAGEEDPTPLLRAAAGALLLFGPIAAVLTASIGLSWSARLSGAAGDLALARFAFFCLAASLVAEYVLAYGMGVLRGIQRFEIANRLVVAGSLLRLGGVAVLALAGVGLRGIATWWAIAGVTNAMTAIIVVERLARPFGFRWGYPRWSVLRSYAGFGLGSQGVDLARGWLWQLPTLAISAWSGAAAVVPYYIGQRLPHALVGLARGGAAPLFPASAEHSGARDAGDLLRASTRWLFLFALPPCVFSIFFAPELLRWLMQAEPVALAIAVLRVSAIAMLFEAVASGAVATLWGAGRVRDLLSVQSATLGLYAAGAVAFTRPFGNIGFALALAPATLCFALVVLHRAFRLSRPDAMTAVRECVRGFAFPASVLIAAWAFARSRPIEGASALLAVGGVGFGVFATLVLAANRDLRAPFRELRPLQTAWWLLCALREMLLDSPVRNARRADGDFRRARDPFRLESEPEQARMRAALGLLATYGGGHFRALEVGCAEGAFTRLLAPLCESLTAVDVSPIAMERAQQRVTGLAVEFQHWNLQSDVVPGAYDLVVACSIVEYLRRPSAVREAREKLVTATSPGGWLLLENTRFAPTEGWLGRRLRLGGRALDLYFGEHPELERVATEETSWYTQTLFRRRLVTALVPTCASPLVTQTRATAVPVLSRSVAPDRS